MSDEEGEQAQQEALTRYLREISSSTRLTQAQELELAQRIEGVDPEATKQLVVANRRLVVSIAKRYTGQGLSLLDLIQHGNVALADVVPRYDWQHGDRFATYAAKRIGEALMRAVADRDRGLE